MILFFHILALNDLKVLVRVYMPTNAILKFFKVTDNLKQKNKIKLTVIIGCLSGFGNGNLYINLKTQLLCIVSTLH